MATAATVPVCAVTWDLRNDFSTTSNPNNPWQYATKAYQNPAGPIDYYLPAGAEGGYPTVLGWSDGSQARIFKNVGSTGVAMWYGPTVMAGQMYIHPGWGPMPVARWQSPIAGTVDVFAEFSSINAAGSNSDVYVVHNGTILFTDIVIGYGGGFEPWHTPFGSNPSTSWNGLLNVQANDTIDFVIGGNPADPQNYTPADFDDFMDLDAVITVVPEPSGLLALGGSLIGLVGFAFRRRK